MHLKLYAFDTLMEYYKFEKDCEKNLIDAVINHSDPLLRKTLFPRLFEAKCSEKIKMINKIDYCIFEFKGKLYFSKSMLDVFDIYPVNPNLQQEEEEIRQFLLFMVDHQLYHTISEADLTGNFWDDYHLLLYHILFSALRS